MLSLQTWWVGRRRRVATRVGSPVPCGVTSTVDTRTRLRRRRRRRRAANRRRKRGRWATTSCGWVIDRRRQRRPERTADWASRRCCDRSAAIASSTEIRRRNSSTPSPSSHTSGTAFLRGSVGVAVWWAAGGRRAAGKDVLAGSRRAWPSVQLARIKRQLDTWNGVSPDILAFLS